MASQAAAERVAQDFVGVQIVERQLVGRGAAHHLAIQISSGGIANDGVQLVAIAGDFGLICSHVQTIR